MNRNSYTIEAGRHIYRNGRPFISINREGDTFPTEADTATRVIRHLLTLLDSANAHRMEPKQDLEAYRDGDELVCTIGIHMR